MEGRKCSDYSVIENHYEGEIWINVENVPTKVAMSDGHKLLRDVHQLIFTVLQRRENRGWIGRKGKTTLGLQL